MNLKHFYRWLDHPLLLFGATASLLLGTLTWLAWHTLEQDRALVDQRMLERLDSTADLVTVALQDQFSDVTEQLIHLANSPDVNLAEALSLDPNGIDHEALMAVLEAGTLEVYPRTSLRYYPAISNRVEEQTEAFAAGEYDEFQRKDYASAIKAYRRLTSSADETTRVGAAVRLARVLRKANDLQAALEVYGELVNSDTGTLNGLPIELLARHARCVLLEELQQVSDLQQEAHILWSALQQARWPLTRAAYHFYEQESLRWVDTEQLSQGATTIQRNQGLILAAAVEELWRQWQGIQRGEVPPTGEHSLWMMDSPVLLIWRGTQERMAALVARPDYLERVWLAPVQPVVKQQGVRIAMADAEGHPVIGEWTDENTQQALRTAAQIQLPWTLQVTSSDPSVLLSEMTERRRLFLIGLATMTALILVASYAIIRSVTRELKVARLQGDFVSTVSHEFRTPLASLCHLSELLVEGRVPNEQRRQEYYRALQRESERLHHLVESILDFRRMEVGAREYRLEKLDGGRLVREVAEEFAQEARNRGYTVEIQVEESLPHLQADREALGRAIWNLLDNAVKYSPNCKTVEIQACREGDEVVIQVRDRGLGITRLEQQQIFDKFFRAASATSAGAKGTGLGLAMVKHIVTAHGGRLHVESQPNVGSTFTICLPFERNLI